MEFTTLIAERRSVRKFSSAPNHEELVEILNAARMAPSWKNSQTTRWYVVENQEKLEQIRLALHAVNQKKVTNATLIVSTYVRDIAGFTKGEADNEVGNGWGAYDLGLHDAYLILAAKNAGYDTLIVGLRDADKIRSALSIPEDEDTIEGEMGIEKYYDKLLKGKDGYVTYQKDLKGYKIADTKEMREEAIEGKDIYLTVDSNIQFFIEQALNNAKKDYGFEWFTMVVADAKTGAILGLSQSPSFDPNLRNMENYLDLTVASAYEPGSTMKTFTYMAAMENGVYNGEETYKSGTYETSDGTVIGDWNRNGWGVISYDRGYALSSNVGVINIISRHMNSAMLRQYFRKLGFGTKTRIALPNEVAGSLNFKYETEIYNAGFGQGITTTPLQNIQALSPLTNDGMLLKPYIVDKIVNPSTNEVVMTGKKDEIERVASSATVQKMISLMDDTVNGIGNTGSGYRIDSHELIGKTGTAQIASEKGGGYLSGKSDIISSFSGIYPKSNPQIIIYASVKRPSEGSQKPISNAVKEVVLNTGKYLGTEKENSKADLEEYELPNFINKSIDKVKTNLNSKGMKYVILGNGNKVIKQFPKNKTKVTNKDTIYIVTNDSNYKIPNVVGLSSKEAESVLKLLNVKVKLEGSGYVISQSIAPDTVITDGMEITLALNKKFES